MQPNRSLPNSENITRVELANGITVLVYENHSAQSVVIAGSLPGGSLYEDPTVKGGLAAMTASALMRGTQHRDFAALHSELEDIGADLGVNAGTHRVSFSGKSLAEDLPVLLDVLNDVLRYPAFPEQQVERLRGEALTWLQYQEQDTRRQAARAFREQLYPADFPYHYAPRGTLQTLPQITLDDLHTFHQQVYSPQGMILAIVGAVTALATVELVERTLGDWQNNQQAPLAELPPLAPLTDVRQVQVTIPGKTQSDLMIGVVGPSRFSDDYHAANLANSILGQFGMMGRIGDVVREQSGMAYYAYSRLDGGLGPGAWSIAAGVNPVNIERAIDLSLSEVKRLIEERVSDDDLEDNQAYFTGRLPLQLERNEGIAGTLLSIEMYNLGLDYLLHYHDLIYSLTHDDLMRAVQHYWQRDAYVVAIAGS